MRAAVDILLPVLAAGEPSKTPFYVAGGVLAAWAVIVAVLGIVRPDFPGNTAAARAVMGASGLLVAVTVATAISTSTKHHAEAEAGEPGGAQGHEATPSGSAPSGATVDIGADPSGQLKYEQSSVTALPGEVTIDFDNPSPVQHDVTIARGGEKLGGTKVIAESKTSAGVTLEPGSYVFYCSVDGHRQAGMEGTLSVQP